MAGQPDTAAQSEWARGWPSILVGMAGMALTGIAVYSIGQIMAPMSAELGWSRTQITSGLMVFAITSLFALPMVGRLVDRVGPRRVAMPGTVLMGASFAALGLVNGSLALWWALWVLFTLGSAAANPVIWATIVSRLFVRGRGLAIGVMMCGSALGAACTPLLTRWAIDAFGWRLAFGVVGMTYSLITCLLVVTCVDGAPPAAEGQAAGAHGAPPAPGDGPVQSGLTFQEAMRDRWVIALLAGIFLIMVLVVSLTVHMIPILGERGIPLATAAPMAAGIAIGSIVGKLAVGWIADRTASRLVPAACFAVPGATCLLLLLAQGPGLLILAAIFLTGLGAGSLLQLSAYLVARYVGMRSFAQVYSIATALLALTGGFGPMLAGFVFDVAGSYRPLLLAGIPWSLAIAAVIAALKPYPAFETPTAEPCEGELLPAG
ncbi:MFS transporter [Novosphingobium bradum]|uniref:MFS transporter n=1 Tax=Novosphingobium bradum TaxID=1737444 RepID=A0ABV7IRL3_9SPHN